MGADVEGAGTVGIQDELLDDGRVLSVSLHDQDHQSELSLGLLTGDGAVSLAGLTADIWHLLCDSYHRDWKTCNTALNSFERIAFKTIVVVLPVLPIHHKFCL